MAVVTALRERPRGRVDVELDGAPWRTLPADAVVRSGLLVGRALDRPTARTLARRGYGDEAIRFTLEEEGFAGEALEEALAGLAPEAERARALLAAGRSARWLAARGFEVAPDT